jgi:hypothetical protein
MSDPEWGEAKAEEIRYRNESYVPPLDIGVCG